MTSGHFGGACAPFAHPWIRAYYEKDYSVFTNWKSPLFFI